MEEIWKVYKETNSKTWGHRIYEVSDQGNVKINGNKVNLQNYKGKYYYIGCTHIHRIVAELFVPNPNNYNEVDHIDRNTHNNNKNNLRWVTHIENVNNRKDMSGKNNPMYNKHHTTEAKSKISKSSKQRKRSDISINRKNTKFMNDGYTQVYVKPEFWGEFLDIGFTFGKLKK